jgi:hypothetical protein
MGDGCFLRFTACCIGAGRRRDERAHAHPLEQPAATPIAGTVAASAPATNEGDGPMKQKNLILMVVAVGCGLLAAFLTAR